jgi:hypothetical protein
MDYLIYRFSRWNKEYSAFQILVQNPAIGSDFETMSPIFSLRSKQHPEMKYIGQTLIVYLRGTSRYLDFMVTRVNRSISPVKFSQYMLNALKTRLNKPGLEVHSLPDDMFVIRDGGTL